jgi:hypothetical protein
MILQIIFNLAWLINFQEISRLHPIEREIDILIKFLTPILILILKEIRWKSRLFKIILLFKIQLFLQKKLSKHKVKMWIKIEIIKYTKTSKRYCKRTLFKYRKRNFLLKKQLPWCFLDSIFKTKKKAKYQALLVPREALMNNFKNSAKNSSKFLKTKR